MNSICVDSSTTRARTLSRFVGPAEKFICTKVRKESYTDGKTLKTSKPLSTSLATSPSVSGFSKNAKLRELATGKTKNSYEPVDKER